MNVRPRLEHGAGADVLGDELPVVTPEERDAVEIFSKQLTENGLYKIWPQEPLAKGEYAVVEYEEGKSDPRVWDFRIE